MNYFSSRMTTLFIGNLSSRTGSLDLEQAFEEFGKIHSAKVIADKKYGFVEYTSPEDAKKALEKMDKSVLHESTIIVEVAKGKSRAGERDSRYSDRRDSRYRTSRGRECYNCKELGHM